MYYPLDYRPILARIPDEAKQKIPSSLMAEVMKDSLRSM